MINEMGRYLSVYIYIVRGGGAEGRLNRGKESKGSEWVWVSPVCMQ